MQKIWHFLLDYEKDAYRQGEKWNKKADIWASMNNCESVMNIDFKVANKFKQVGEFTTIEFTNNEG